MSLVLGKSFALLLLVALLPSSQSLSGAAGVSACGLGPWAVAQVPPGPCEVVLPKKEREVQGQPWRDCLASTFSSSCWVDSELCIH